MGYILRLICLCLASFFVLQLILGIAVVLASNLIVRHADSKTSPQAVWMLFGLRLLPVLVSLAMVVLLCAPSYLRYEQNKSAEPVGYLCKSLALLGFSLWLLAILKTLRAIFMAWSFARGCRTPVHFPELAAANDIAYLIDGQSDPGPGLALVGIWRPKLLLSRQVVNTLTSEQLQAAISHELAHRRAWDNLKWLILALTPDLLPFVRSFRRLDAQLAQAVEFAADDEAVADREYRCVALAEAILQVARLRNDATCVPLASLLTNADKQLACRIERLLTSSRMREGFSPIPLILCICFVALITLSAGCGALRPVHEFLESLLH